MPDFERGGDLLLAQSEYAMVKDGATGEVLVLNGFHKEGMSETDVPVKYDASAGRFLPCSPAQSILPCPCAKEDQYIVLTNPALTDGAEHPPRGKQGAAKLSMGRTVNIAGPATFGLWPRQVAEVVDGHILRSNQYLLVRVVNGELARDNWNQSVLKPKTIEGGGDKGKKNDDGEESPSDEISQKTLEQTDDAPPLITGQLLIIKGTDFSFYIPSTGIEVVRDQDSGSYVRDAITLEQLEYCILLGEDGIKEFIRGPSVVFPKPTQIFSRGEDGKRKFKAIELTEISGIYVKVIKAYEEGDKKYKEGQEIFITGDAQKIYFPRVEHSIISYGNNMINYATAIPKGDALYNMDRLKGNVELVKGPKMFLPDPLKEVIVQRVVDPGLIKLMYPDNHQALEHNEKLLPKVAAQTYGTTRGVRSKSLRGRAERARADEMVAFSATAFVPEAASETMVPADEFARKSTYTPPRTIQLNNKYNGAVAMRIWTGYAVKIVNKSGDSRIVVGPAPAMLEYDEVPEVISLSTGKPKNTDMLHRDVYLKVKANTVSDVIKAETRDFVKVEIPIIYRVNFEGEQKKWFDVENYVKFLCDHCRSLVANAVKRMGIEDFCSNYIDVLRDTILGVPEGEKKERKGRSFRENNMKIYDVELSKRLVIGDEDISHMLQTSQHQAVSRALKLARAKEDLVITKEQESIDQEIEELQSGTTIKKLDLRRKELEKNLELTLSNLTSEATAGTAKLEAELSQQETRDEIQKSELARQKAEHNLELEKQQAELKQLLEKIKAETESVAEKSKAISPDLIAALQACGDKHAIAAMAESMGPMALLGGGSLVEVVGNIFKGTRLEETLVKKLLEVIDKTKESDPAPQAPAAR